MSGFVRPSSTPRRWRTALRAGALAAGLAVVVGAPLAAQAERWQGSIYVGPSYGYYPPPSYGYYAPSYRYGYYGPSYGYYGGYGYAPSYSYGYGYAYPDLSLNFNSR
jgi:hypothetical protein